MTTADAQLAELAAQIRDHTLCTALLHTAGAHGSQPAYSDKMGKGATTRTWTWERFRNDVLDLAAGLLDHDVARGIALAFGVHLRSATGLSEATPPSGRISRIAVRRGTAPQRCASGAVRIFGTVSTLLPS